MARLVLHLFGSPGMEIDGRTVEVDTRKAIALMAYLAVTGETHQRDTLSTLLWPDYDQANARAALRRTLSTLNKALGGEGEGKHLEIARESVGISPGADLWLDINEFHRQLNLLHTHGHARNEVCPACPDILVSAVALYREPFMAGFNLRDSANFEEWQFFQEETLRRELSETLEKLVFGLKEAGRVEEAILYARRWLALDSLLEEAHRQLMILFSKADQRNAALRQYRECVRILDYELGVSPLDETTQLYEAILNRDPLPEKETRLRYIPGNPSVTRTDEYQPATNQEEHSRQIETHTNRAAPGLRDFTVPAHPFIGRDSEKHLLQETYETFQEAGGFIGLVGEAGIGKTRLAEDFLAYARNRGGQIIQARCYAGETGLAYAPFLQGLNAAANLLRDHPAGLSRLKSLPPAVLAEVGRLLPELNQVLPGVQPPAASGEAAQARFFEALRQMITALLGGSPPGILFLDDLHWADSASLDLLTYLARRLRGAGMFILATWRDEPGETTHALERLTGELKRAGQAVRVQLRRLDSNEIVTLVKEFPGSPWKETESLGRRLYEESEGLPYVAVEYLAALAKQGQPPVDGQGLIWEMPTSVRNLLHSRLSGLDSTAMQILSTAATIGRSFDFTTLREASGRSEFETIEGLEKLLAAGLVTEEVGKSTTNSIAMDIRYDFTHEKLRTLIYEETSLARRRLLHRRIAETLARPQAAGVDLSSLAAGLIAYHFQQAGQEAKAAEYHLLAGEHARQLFANNEAMAHFQAALASGLEDRAYLHEAIGDLYTLRGDYQAALHSFQTAAALCKPECQANLEHKLGNVHQRMGEWELAESHYQASMEALGDPDEPGNGNEIVFRVHLFSDRSLAAYSLGNIEYAQEMAARALALAEKCAEPHALAQAHNILGVLARAGGDRANAIRYLEASLAAAEALNDPTTRIAALNNLALAYGENSSQEQGHLLRAIELAQEALNLCIKIGDRHRQAALHNNLADLLHQSRRDEEAMAQLKQAVVIFAEIGGEQNLLSAGIETTGSGRAGIWKLTEW